MRGQIATDAGHTIQTMLLCNTVLAMCQWAWSWWVMWLVGNSDLPGACVLPRRRQKIKWKSARLFGWVRWRHNSSQSERASSLTNQSAPPQPTANQSAPPQPTANQRPLRLFTPFAYYSCAFSLDHTRHVARYTCIIGTYGRSAGFRRVARPILQNSLCFDGKDHWPIKGSSKYLHCKHCSRRTAYICKKCNVPINIDCFVVYHTSWKTVIEWKSV